MRRASWESRALAGGSVLLGCLLGLGAARADTRPSYVGAGACSASNCHGSVVPRRDSKLSLQNEYITWYKQDRHAKAYSALSEERALRIARRPPGAGLRARHLRRQSSRPLDGARGERRLVPGRPVARGAGRRPARGGTPSAPPGPRRGLAGLRGL